MATHPTRSGEGAETVTPQTQAAATGDGFVTYDQLTGPELDAARWSPARLPLPTGGEHIPLDPNAKLAVGNGEVQVTIPRFSLSHDTFQPADSAKYLIVSTRQFQLPPDRPATFAVDLAVENIGGEPGDFRRGMAAFQVGDEVSMRALRHRHRHPGVRAGRAATPGRWRSGRAVHLRGRVALRGLRRRRYPASRLRSYPRPGRLDRGLARRRPHGVRDPRHLDPRTRSHRVWDLDDAADPGRSQSLAGRAGPDRAVAPVPGPRGRRVSRHQGRPAVLTGPRSGSGGSTRVILPARAPSTPAHFVGPPGFFLGDSMGLTSTGRDFSPCSPNPRQRPGKRVRRHAPIPAPTLRRPGVSTTRCAAPAGWAVHPGRIRNQRSSPPS
jgi:Family of unknown function (DUF6081)